MNAKSLLFFIFAAVIICGILLLVKPLDEDKPTAIVIHLSASEWGDSESIRVWHADQGWDDIGYHAVILNGRRSRNSAYDRALDGKIELGRSEGLWGIHCRADDMNRKALGVCLIGDPQMPGYPTERQIEALVHYLATKCRTYDIPVSAITQHSDHDPLKPLCASLDVEEIRRLVADRLARGF